jgi:uncharacterized protein (TIGR00730 family)
MKKKTVKSKQIAKKKASSPKKTAAKKSTPLRSVPVRRFTSPKRSATSNKKTKSSPIASIAAGFITASSAADKEKKALARHLDERLQNLYDRTAIIERQLVNLSDNRFYRTCIFGSARIKPDSKLYEDVHELARFLAWEGIDVLTGGGPGLMEAANKGAAFGRTERKTRSMTYGLSIELPFEPDYNKHLDVKRHHQKFSTRLDDFMRLSHSIICTPGGIGTVLELFFSWQLIQVKHISPRPIVLMGKDFWQGIVKWMREFPLAQKLVSAEDFDFIYIVDSAQEAASLIQDHHEKFRTNTSTIARR